MDPVAREVFVITRSPVNPKGVTIYSPKAVHPGIPVALATTFEHAIGLIRSRMLAERDAGEDRYDYAFHGPFPIPPETP